MAGKLDVTEAGDELVGFITCPNQESADKLATVLVENRATACVNIIPGLTSVYRWQGEVCRDQELLLMVKTTVEKRAQVAELVGEHHPYTEPELLFLSIHSGSASYLAWLSDQVNSNS